MIEYEEMFETLSHNIILMLSQIEGNTEFATKEPCSQVDKKLEFIEKRIKEIRQKIDSHVSEDSLNAKLVDSETSDVKSTNSAPKELDYRNYGWSWDDDGMLGDFTFTCVCGNKNKLGTVTVNEADEEDACEKCKRKIIVKRETKVFLKGVEDTKSAPKCCGKLYVKNTAHQTCIPTVRCPECREDTQHAHHTNCPLDGKGCGKEFMYLAYLNDKRICGQMEDLKHSDHIILCPECSEKDKQACSDSKCACKGKKGCGIKVAVMNGKDINCGEEMLGRKRFCNQCLNQDKDEGGQK